MALLHLAAYKNHVGLVEFCLHSDPRQDAIVEPYGTPFTSACSGGSTDVIGIFLAGCSDDAALARLLNRGGCIGTALHHAARVGETSTVELLLDIGAAVDLRNEEGYTALALAVENGHAETVRVLCEKGGADTTLATTWGQSSVDLAILAPRDSQVLQTLIDTTPAEVLDHPNGISYYPAHTAAAANNVDALQLLLTTGFEFDHATTAQLTPVHYAAFGGAVDALAWLCDSFGMACDHPSVDGSLPLHLAAEAGHTGAVQWLLARSSETATVGIANAQGYTALHLAAMNGHGEVISSLLRAEPPADPTSTTLRGETPLVLARSHGHEEVEAQLESINDTAPQAIVRVRAECKSDARGKEYAQPTMFMSKMQIQSEVVCEL